MIVNKGKASNTTKKLLWGFFFFFFRFFFFQPSLHGHSLGV